jgi:hypothetical protein
MASSMQGEGFFSSLLPEPLTTVNVSNLRLIKRKSDKWHRTLEDHCVNLPLGVPNLPQQHAWRLAFLSQAGVLWEETEG